MSQPKKSGADAGVRAPDDYEKDYMAAGGTVLQT